MASNPDEDSPPPPALFRHGQALARKRQARSDRSNRSNRSNRSDASTTAHDNESQHAPSVPEPLQPPVAEPLNISLENAGPAPVPNPIPRVDGISNLLGLDTLFDQNPLLNLVNREPDDTSDRDTGDPAVVRRNPPGALTETSSRSETVPVPVPVPVASTLPELTQNNIQNNNQNTYNLTVNNTYGEGIGFGGGGGGRGGRGGGRWWFPPCGPYCTLPLILLVVLIVFVMAAAYGITTIWSNTVTSIQSSFSGLASFVGLGYFAASSTKKPEPSATITFGKATSSVMPTPIVPSPSGIVKAIDDVDHWVSILAQWPDTEVCLSENGVFWNGEGSVGFEHVGGFRDAWIVLSEDLRNLERRVHRAFALVDKDVSQFLDELRGYPATIRWHLDANRSPWQKLVAYLPWSGDKSPFDVLYANHQRAEALSSRTAIGHDIITVDTTNSIKKRLGRLSEGACGLRDSIEITGERLTWAGVDDDGGLGDGVTTVASRGNLLCDIFARAELRVKNLHKTLVELDESAQIPDALTMTMVSIRALRHPRREILRKAEDDLVEWISRLAGPVRKLHHLEFD
ncbi:hypothetical protein CEP54_014684 [Fusarium duplospermum]|uniref:Uncharacterized protein n=1 Tax=Fusarium duplospermum TaxID=1325734 RepID=A0A428NUK0_9HYPO|nr:hypothetical protein CEP54_014684 [Fusarium duplospermum]